jgi:chemotaxis family two-component system response regulator Rcp1
MNPEPHPIRILLVEDNPGDVRLTLEAFKDSKMENPMDVVPDGVEALAYLRHEGAYRDKPTPDLILLDLNLPRMDGREVLAAVKADPALKSIPVVVLTTSKAEQDVLRSYLLQASCFITKPVDFNQFSDVVKGIDSFWLSIVTLPAGAHV